MGPPHPQPGVLAAFIDGRLAEADRLACVAHLSQCVECRVILTTFARGSVQEPASINAVGSPIPQQKRKFLSP